MELEVLGLKYSSVQMQQMDLSLLLLVEQTIQMDSRKLLEVELELVHILKEPYKE